MNKVSDLFLEDRRDKEIIITQANGPSIVGKLITWDAFTIVIRNGNTTLLFFKHSISYIE